MATFLAVAVIFAAPLLLMYLAGRVILRWEDGWRYAAILPATALLVDAWIAGFRTSPHGDGFLPMAALNVITLLVMYALSEMRSRDRSSRPAGPHHIA